MNKDFRFALLNGLEKAAPVKVIDFTNYTIKAHEPAEMTRRWSLLGEINQKQTRPQDRPIPVDSLSDNARKLINKHYPQITGYR
ncbi:hypothetical protein RG47T_0032 [Mucilaginibacter polytrichastri]|uniref:DUF3864 domain-containing protein n=2 Tax=Mucilaginibacter polytrichastri TaxID=1302689 RepID=A0A1Q5ZS49_9SPHI|nr:DUF3864 domain-containing protein [Mucilaginibacter polytrichastri]OKS84600.1 hypothetical protein RG47T_0032 [Mucilaginibacter polytrichastri]SFT02475.1 protein of unknown function [Mucilaginibacter polytrichastri]